MKTVEVFRTFDYRAHPMRSIQFKEGYTYRRVIEAAAAAIVAAGAGRVVAPAEHESRHAAGLNVVDCWHVWQR